jgi:quercetin dioxygenase-like cupin family protein
VSARQAARGRHEAVSPPAKDVSDKVLSAIDLGAQRIAIKGHQFRIRLLEIKPGGIVPWHSHGERPALIYIVSGEVVECEQLVKI